MKAEADVDRASQDLLFRSFALCHPTSPSCKFFYFQSVDDHPQSLDLTFFDHFALVLSLRGFWKGRNFLSRMFSTKRCANIGMSNFNTLQSGNEKLNLFCLIISRFQIIFKMKSYPPILHASLNNFDHNPFIERIPFIWTIKIQSFTFKKHDSIFG